MKLATPLAIVALLIAVAAMFMVTSGASIRAGGTLPTTSYDATLIAKQGVRVGSTTAATTLKFVSAGTCNISFIGTPTLQASTTGQFYCAVSGINVGDKILAMLPVGAGAHASGSGSTGQGFAILSAYATSTGIIGFTLSNNSGAATSSFAQATTSVQFWAFRY